MTRDRGLLARGQFEYSFDLSPGGQDQLLSQLSLRPYGQVFPVSGYFKLLRKVLVERLGLRCDRKKVTFQDFVIHRILLLHNSNEVKLRVSTQSCGTFEVHHQDHLVASGTVSIHDLTLDPGAEEDDLHHHDLPLPSLTTMEGKVLSTQPALDALDLRGTWMTSTEVDLLLRDVGIEYGPDLQTVESIDIEGDKGRLQWNGIDWSICLEGLLQIHQINAGLRHNHCILRAIKKCDINYAEAKKALNKSEKTGLQGLDVTYDQKSNTISAPGIALHGVLLCPLNNFPGLQAVGHETVGVPVETQQFVPFFETNIRDPKSQPNLLIYFELVRRHAQNVIVGLIESGYRSDVLNADLIRAILSQPKAESDLKSYEHHIGSFPIDNPRHTLFKYFRSSYLTKDSPDFIPHAMRSLKTLHLEWLKDKLVHNMWQERILKCCVDIAFENIQPSQEALNFLFILPEQDEQHIAPEIFQSFRKNSKANITCCSLNKLSQNVNGHKEVDSVRFVSVQYMDEMAEYLNTADIVVCHCCLNQERDITETLLRMKRFMKSSSYLLVIEPTSVLLIPLLIYLFQPQKPVMGDSPTRICGPYCDEMTWAHKLADADLEIVAQKSDGLVFTMFLCKKMAPKPSDPPQEPIFIEVSDNDFGWLHQMDKELSKPGDQYVWLRKGGVFHSGVHDLIQMLRCRPGGSRLRYEKDNFTEYRCITNATIDHKTALPHQWSSEMRLVYKKGLMINALRSGKWGTYRTVSLNTERNNLDVHHAHITQVVVDGESSWKWAPNIDPQHFQNTKHMCHVYAAALCDQDRQHSLCAKSEGCVMFGCEFAGRDNMGTRVMGLVPSQALATTVMADQVYVWPIPDSWTMCQAATVPLPYCLAYLAVYVRGRLASAEALVVLGADSLVGQAVIAITSSHEHVTAVVGSEQEKNILQEVTEGKAKKILMYDDDYLKTVEGNSGVLVIYTGSTQQIQECYHKDSKRAKLKTRFVRVCDADEDLESDVPQPLVTMSEDPNSSQFEFSFGADLPSPTSANVTNVSSQSLFEGGADGVVMKVSSWLRRGLRESKIMPLSYSYFSVDLVEQAFKELQKGAVTDKIVIEIREDDGADLAAPSLLTVKAIPKVTCLPEYTYILIGDLTEDTMSLAEWLVDHGVKKIVLNTKHGIEGDKYRVWILKLAQRGISIAVSLADVTKLRETVQLVKNAQMIGPVGGIIYTQFQQLRSILSQEPKKKKTLKDSFDNLVKPLLAAMVHLDRVSRQLCSSSLHLFVVWNPNGIQIAGPYGSTYVDAFMERVCEQRKCEALPALSIRGLPSTPRDDEPHNVYCVQGSKQEIINKLDTLVYLPDSVILTHIGPPHPPPDIPDITNEILDAGVSQEQDGFQLHRSESACSISAKITKITSTVTTTRTPGKLRKRPKSMLVTPSKDTAEQRKGRSGQKAKRPKSTLLSGTDYSRNVISKDTIIEDSDTSMSEIPVDSDATDTSAVSSSVDSSQKDESENVQSFKQSVNAEVNTERHQLVSSGSRKETSMVQENNIGPDATVTNYVENKVKEPANIKVDVNGHFNTTSSGTVKSTPSPIFRTSLFSNISPTNLNNQTSAIKTEETAPENQENDRRTRSVSNVSDREPLTILSPKLRRHESMPAKQKSEIHFKITRVTPKKLSQMILPTSPRSTDQHIPTVTSPQVSGGTLKDRRASVPEQLLTSKDSSPVPEQPKKQHRYSTPSRQDSVPEEVFKTDENNSKSSSVTSHTGIRGESPLPRERRRRRTGSHQSDRDNLESPVGINLLKSFITSFPPLHVFLKLNNTSGKDRLCFVVHSEVATAHYMQDIMHGVWVPVFGLQCGYDAPLKSVEELATFHLKKLQPMQSKGPYNLVGHSFGACLAFEMALQLQKLGHQVQNLILIEGSPAYLPVYLEECRKKWTSGTRLSDSAGRRDTVHLLHFALEYMDMDYDCLKTLGKIEFSACKSYLLDQLTSSCTSQSNERPKWDAFFNSYCKMLRLAERYMAKGQLKDTDVKLIIGQSHKLQSVENNLDSYYGLTELCTGAVSLQRVPSDRNIIQSSSQLCRILNHILCPGHTPPPREELLKRRSRAGSSQENLATMPPLANIPRRKRNSIDLNVLLDTAPSTNV